MNENSIETQSRRLLIKGAVLLVAVAIVPSLAAADKAPADAKTKLPKTDVRYQDEPKAGKDCDDCIQFIPGKTSKVKGTCKIVEGDISPTGYCLAFTPKPKRG